MFKILPTLIVALSFEAKAESLPNTIINDFVAHKLSVEAQFNTMSNSTSATFGPSIFYNFNEVDSIGARFLAPLEYNSGTVSLMSVYRHHFNPAKTSFFVELSLGSNFYKKEYGSLNAPSVGTNLGVIHKMNSDMSFGGLAGGEWTNTHLGKNYAYNNSSNVVIYGRLSVFGMVNF